MGRKLYDVMFRLPDMGVGHKFTRGVWNKYPGTYWEITRVVPNVRAGDRGKVWGTFTFKFMQQTRNGEPWVRHVRGPLKREWREVTEQDIEEWRRQAAQASTIAGNTGTAASSATAATAAGAGGEDLPLDVEASA